VKAILRNYGLRMSTEQRQVARAQAADMTRTRSTGRVPKPPRDVFVQSGPRGILLNWRPPEGFADDITGWRIYKGDESSLFAEIKDATTRQHFIETTAGAAPPITNLFVSAINQLGQESPLIPTQGAALVEAGAPTMPNTPPTYHLPQFVNGVLIK